MKALSIRDTPLDSALSLRLPQKDGNIYTDKEKIYHCGTSSKDAGGRITTITKIEDTALYGAITFELANNPPLKLK